MTPLVFSGNRGWLHLPLGHSPLRAGIVFFSAYGVEDLATRHSLACLAERLAVAGHPVLRFDLPGTGDALGNWDDAASLSAWVDAGLAAVDILRSVSGSDSVSLLGLRLGGLIASLVTHQLQADGQTVLGLALLAPILDGRQYMREYRALSDGSLPLTVAGFPINEALRQAIAGCSPNKFANVAAQRVFLAAPGTAKYLPELEIAWRKHVPVYAVPYAGLADHIGNPTLSRTPTGMFESLERWFGEYLLTAEKAEINRPAITVPTIAQGTLACSDFVEDGTILDIENGLVGIWCSPNGPSAHAVVIFCNAGRNPHIGWARSSVTLARRLAQHGIASLRFDLAGLGDSLPMSGQSVELLYSKVGIPQLAAVLDAVQKRFGIAPKICLVGACSGGYLAFHEAVDDKRVASLILVNVQRFIWEEGASLQASMRTAGKSTQAYRQQAFSLKTWMRLVGGKVDVAVVARTLMLRGWHGAIQAASSMGKRLHRIVMAVSCRSPAAMDDPERTIREGFASMAARGAKTVLIYGEDDGGRDEFSRYFGADCNLFTRLPGARLVVIPDTDHDLTPVPAREQLFDEILAACVPPATHAN